MKRKLIGSSPARVLIFGYLLMILLGTLLLSLPIATRSGTAAPFIDSVFTATSATCVTGLVLQDTYTYWSYFGQGVILLLIQVGGLGLITMYIMLSIAIKRKIGLRQRIIMQESISAPRTGGIVKLTRSVFGAALILEVLGAVILAFRFCGQMGVGKGIYFAVFHSVSAFCNAGFDLMGEGGAFSSFTAYSGDAVVNVTLMVLIVIGGLGFYVWDDLWVKRLRVRKYALQTKTVLVFSAFLIIVPALIFFLMEDGSVLANRGAGEKILTSVFQAVTTRTAGFNTVDISTLGEPVLLIFCVLMMIGGSPGSTAGGLKTTTFAILFFAVRSSFKKEASIECFNRRISDDTMKRALTIIAVYLALFIVASIFIAGVEKVGIMAAMFESASAIGTVGLTTGITPQLGNGSRVIIMLLMYFGRVGCLTMLYAMAKNDTSDCSKLPIGEIALG